MNGPVADLITPDHRDRFATAHAIVRGGRPWCRARSEAPPYDRMPTYHADLQAAGFPAEVITFACAIRKANGIIIVSPEYSNGLRHSPGDNLAGSLSLD